MTPAMNRWLSFDEIVFGFPCRKVDAVQDLINQPHIVIGIDRLIESFGKQNLLIARLFGFSKIHRHPPETVILSRKQMPRQGQIA